MILNHDSEAAAPVANCTHSLVARQPDAEDSRHMRLSRLKLAIKCKQKRVSHAFSSGCLSGSLWVHELELRLIPYCPLGGDAYISKISNELSELMFVYNYCIHLCGIALY